MDLADPIEREGVDIGHGFEAVIGGGDVDIVDVEQEATSGPSGDRGQKFDLAHVRGFERDIGCGILQQHAHAQAVLHLVDMGADAREGLGIVGQRQEVVEKPPVVGRPRQMLGEQLRPVAIDETPQASEM